MLKSLLSATLLLSLFTSPASAVTIEGLSLCVSTAMKDCACEAPLPSVFTMDSSEVFARVALAPSGNFQVAYTWFYPDGTIASQSVKTASYSKKGDAYYAWDEVKTMRVAGWWRVDAEYEGGMLSKEFLVTENRQVVTVLSGSQSAKMRVIRNVAPSGEFGRDVLVPATEDADPEVRAAALERMAGATGDWAANAVREGLMDGDSRVRLAAVRFASPLPEFERGLVYMQSLSSGEPEMRLAAVRGLDGYPGEKSTAALAASLADRHPAVRLAALEALIRRDAHIPDANLERLVSDRDYRVAVTALNTALGMEKGEAKYRVLAAAAMSEHPDQARRAVDALIDTGGAPPPVLMLHFRDGYRRSDIITALKSDPSGEATSYLVEAYRLLINDYAGLRLDAVKGLSGRGEETLPALTEAVRDGSAEIRLEALNAVKLLPDGPDKTRLAAMALADGDPLVRNKALGIMADIGTPDAYTSILELLDDPMLRGEALERARAAASPEVQKILARRGMTAADARLRLTILKALADDGADTVLISEYMRDKDLDVRIAAVEALVSLGGPEAALTLYKAGKDPDPRVRDAAVRGLLALKPEDRRGGVALMFERGEADEQAVGLAALAETDPAALETLVKSIPAYDTPRLRAALTPIAARGGASSLPALAEGLKAEDAELAAEVVRSISALADGAADSLARAFTERPGLRRVILESTRVTKHSARIRRLALTEGGRELKLMALDDLSGVPGKDAAGIASLAMKDEDPEVRRFAAGAAGKIGLEDALLTAAGDRSAGVRVAAAEGLSMLPGEKSAKALGVLVLDTDEKVSAAALAGLARVGDEVPPGVWTRLAERPAPVNARVAAVESLGKARHTDGLPVLARALADEDAGVAEAAIEAMARIGSAALPGAYAALGDKKTRPRAIELLKRLPDPASEEHLLSILNALEGRELALAVEVLGRVGTEKSLGALAGVYRAGDSAVRITVLKALSVLNVTGDEQELYEVLGDALDSPDEALRFYAASAAGKRRVPGLKDKLQGMLETEPSQLVRREISVALGGL